MPMNAVQEGEAGGWIAPDDEATLTHLYPEHAQVLYNFAVRVLESEDDAADAVAEVFVSATRDGAVGAASPAPPGILLLSRMRTLLIARTRSSGRLRPSRDVDLWSIMTTPDPGQGGGVDRVPSGSPSVEIARGMVGRCGVVSSAVISMAYFGGYRIPEIAERLSMTAAECRSRLHGCLEHLSAGIQGRHRGPGHDVRFSVCASAHALGVITAEDEPEYFSHRSGGCLQCEDECSTYEGAAHHLPGILPDVKLPPELPERIRFALKLAAIADPGGSISAARDEAASPGPGDAGGDIAGDASNVHGSGRGEGVIASRGRWTPVLATAGVFVALLVIATIGWYVRTLSGKIDEQANLIDLLHNRQTELVVRNARLEGISRFFELKGVVTVLTGSDAFPGLSGKLVLDTTGGSAMLQIMNLPADLGRGRIAVQAVGEDASVRLAEFEGAWRDTGAVLYRFFPVATGETLLTGLVTVEALGDDRTRPGAYHRIMEGSIPLRP